MAENNLKITAIILAAGQSTRMGSSNKLLMHWQGKPLVQHVCDAALASKCSDVVVVTGHQGAKIAQALTGNKVIFADNDNYASGIASSIIAGLAKARKFDANAVIILLGDMPQITAAMIDKIIEVGQNSDPEAIIIATSNGKRGNPLLWKEAYFDRLARLKGDKGASQIISEFNDKIIEVELGLPARFDLDTPQAFEDTRPL